MSTTEIPENKPSGPRLGLGLSDGLGPGAEAQPIAYLYHDAASAETANPLLHSTQVLMAADRRPKLRNETPLVTLAQAQAMVAAERERIRMALRAMDSKAGLHNYYGHAAWVLFERPNVE